MENGVGVGRLFLQEVNGLGCGQDDQFDSTALCFPFDFIHDRQPARPRADDKALALPRYFLLSDMGVCPNASRNFFDGFFFRLRTSP